MARRLLVACLGLAAITGCVMKPEAVCDGGCGLDSGACEGGACTSDGGGCDGGACATSRFSFAAPVFFAADPGTTALLVTDLDGDGHADIVTANALSSDLSLLYGRGDGTLGAATALTVGDGPAWIGAADLDGDGRPDLVALDHGSGGFSVVLAAPGGGFAPAQSVTAPSTDKPISAAIADFDSDGHLDVMVSGGDGALSLFAGHGDGTFAPPSFVGGEGFSPAAMTAADLDGDGRAELAVVADMNLTLLLGRPLAPTVIGPGVYQPWNVAAFDLRGSDVGAQSDLVVTSILGGVAVLAALGGGAFAEPLALAGNGNTMPFSIVAADLDADGTIDLATGNQGTSNVSLFAGTGNVTYAAPVAWPIGGGLSQIAAADMNGDGRLDLVACRYTEHDVAVLLSTAR